MEMNLSVIILVIIFQLLLFVYIHSYYVVNVSSVSKNVATVLRRAPKLCSLSNSTHPNSSRLYLFPYYKKEEYFKLQLKTKMETQNLVPVIDLHDFPRQSSKLIFACEQWGCFRILNHDHILPVSLMAEMKQVVMKLVDLPNEIKKRNKDGILGSGYRPLSENNPLYEALGIYDMSSPDDVDAFCNQLGASPSQRETIMKYAAAVHGLMMDIVRKIGEGLGLPNVSFDGWPCQFRMNKYHFTPEAIGSSGVQIHTDSGFLTILQDDECVGGLEVMKKSGEFVSVDPWPNTLLVNLGDIGTVWSNGRFYTVKHRVICKEAKIRVSIASFLLGPMDTTVEPPSELVDAEHPRAFVPFTFNDYQKLRLTTNLRAGETLDLMRAH